MNDTRVTRIGQDLVETIERHAALASRTDETEHDGGSRLLRADRETWLAGSLRLTSSDIAHL